MSLSAIASLGIIAAARTFPPQRFLSASPPNWAEAITALVSASALIAVVFAGLQVRHVNRQMHREFESMYLTRFWAIMDRRSRAFALTGRPRATDRRVVSDYLDLCEDQLSLRSLGRVTNHTWNFWRVDIRAFRVTGAYAEALKSASLAEYPKVRQLIRDPFFDPLRSNWLRRLWDGL